MDKKYMNCTRCELCGTADVIYGSTFMEYSILLRLLTAPLATMGMGLLSATIVKTKGIHINTKVILLVLCISAIICNTGMFAIFSLRKTKIMKGVFFKNKIKFEKKFVPIILLNLNDVLTLLFFETTLNCFILSSYLTTNMMTHD